MRPEQPHAHCAATPLTWTRSWRCVSLATFPSLRIGCFSFQSYKLINAGEGGILVTDDAELAAKCVIMSGAYEHNWKKHDVLDEPFAKWQNQLPLYNVRMQNLSAAVVRSQIGEIDRRVEDGRANHDYVADRLNASPFFVVPPPLGPELRAPDSIQFNLDGVSKDEAKAFAKAAEAQGVKVQIFGLSSDNARAFWNWQFLGDIPELPQTRAMLENACDVRLPARLTKDELDQIVVAMLVAVSEVKGVATRHRLIADAMLVAVSEVTPPIAIATEPIQHLPPLATGWKSVDDHLGARDVPTFDWPPINPSTAAPSSEKYRHCDHWLLAGLTDEPGGVLGAVLPAVKIAEHYDWSEEDVQVRVFKILTQLTSGCVRTKPSLSPSVVWKFLKGGFSLCRCCATRSSTPAASSPSPTRARSSPSMTTWRSPSSSARRRSTPWPRACRSTRRCSRSFARSPPR